MAAPRLFVSSTCYDLQEIRFQLRNFIRDFGYDAVMSEFDDIFYNYETHVQDACLEEISKCQLFILVVGNNYGSFYHQDKQENKVPDSVTLKEFRKALEVKVYKHIFINKYVDYDYKNYKRALDKVTLKYFQDNEISDSQVETVRTQIKKKFDENYHFPFESYKYVFYFLDIINELKENNAINPFESFADIKDNLRKQWAGFMHEALTKKDRIANNLIQSMEGKIERIEKNLSKLIESKTDSNGDKLTFDLSSLSREINWESLEAAQDKIQQLLNDILYYTYTDEYNYEVVMQRIWFLKLFTNDSSQTWLDSLKALTQSFKWSKYINCEIVFKALPYRYNPSYNGIPYKTLFELYSLYSSLKDNDKDGLINTVTQLLNKVYEAPAKQLTPQSVDDLPF